MGDSTDGSSAAQSAPYPDQRPADAAPQQSRQEQAGADQGTQQGLFSRIISALSPSSDTSEQTADRQHAEARASSTAMPLPGLGNLRRMRVDDVSIPKAEIIAVPVDITKEALVDVFRESGFSRLPVYKDTLDKPLGLVLLKDMALEFGFNATNARFNLRKMLRPLLYAPPSMPLGVLLQKMQGDRTHMALVIDEYGGVDGLVTIEDLIEQVIGEIADEHDTEEGNYWTLEKPGVYLALARTPLDEFEAEIGMRLAYGDEDEEIDTLGGLIFVLSGRVPARGEVVRHVSGIQFEVVDADPRRIKRMRVRLPGAAAAPAAASGAVGKTA